jgi:hypothetical protein
MFRQAARPWLAAAAQCSRQPRYVQPAAQAARHYTPSTNTHGLLYPSASRTRSRNDSAVRSYARPSRTTAVEEISAGVEDLEEYEEGEENLEEYEEGMEGLEEYEEGEEGSEEYAEGFEEADEDEETALESAEREEAQDEATAAWQELQQNRANYKTLGMFPV